ncbi:MAG: leucine-rich repeat protein [Clostridia bacterium]|nr:leucine-rich repeat protein [Clostridia bacterium]
MRNVKKLLSLLLAMLVLCQGALIVSAEESCEDSTEAPETSYSGICGENLTWSLDVETGVLDITGTGEMYNQAPWHNYNKYIKTVNISNGVTFVGARAFNECSFLKSISIPDSVTRIAISAFSGCHSLTNVTLGRGITTIAPYTFYGCTSLTSITIPDSVISIRGEAFSGCHSLVDVTIPDSVTRIAISAFSGCHSLTNVTLGRGITTIEPYTFYGCTSLTSITIPDSVISIGGEAFSGCHSLVGVTIPDSVTSIGDASFFRCISLTEIIIPDSVTHIGAEAFSMCYDLASVTIGADVTSIGVSAFYGSTNLSSVYIDSCTIAADLNSHSACGNLVNYAESVMFGEAVADITDYVKNGNPYAESLDYNGKTYYSYSNHEHAWEEYIVEVNGCANPGFDGYKCSECYALKGDFVTIPHDCSAKWYSNSNNHWHLCSVCGDRTDTTEHAFSGDTDKDCNVCGELRNVFGDVNNDSAINSLDAALVLKYDSDLIDETQLALDNADMNRDGEINSLDAAFILRYDAELE